MPHIAAFGQAAFGKDVLSNYLKENLKNNFIWERASFADAVKRVFEDSFGYDREFTEKWKRIPEPPEGLELPVRQSLQLIGDGFRKIKKNIWIEIIFRNKEKNYIISDGRYLNESIHVKKNGGINILIYRKGFMNDDPNPSEAELKSKIQYFDANYEDGPITDEYFDFFIRNDSTLENYYKKIDTILIPYINKRFGDENQ